MASVWPNFGDAGPGRGCWVAAVSAAAWPGRPAVGWQQARATAASSYLSRVVVVDDLVDVQLEESRKIVMLVQSSHVLMVAKVCSYGPSIKADGEVTHQSIIDQTRVILIDVVPFGDGQGSYSCSS